MPTTYPIAHKKVLDPHLSKKDKDKKDKKIEISISNWVLGGSLLSVSTRDGLINGAAASRDERRKKEKEKKAEEAKLRQKKEERKAKEKNDEKKEERKAKEKNDEKKEERKAKEKNDEKKDEVKPKKDRSEEPKPKKDRSKEDKEEPKPEEKKEEPKSAEATPDEATPDEKAEAQQEKVTKKDATPTATTTTTTSEDAPKTETKSSKPPANESPKFTAEQDNKITCLKKDNKSWKEIVAELGGTMAKKDIVNRWKELMEKERKEKKDERESEWDGLRAINLDDDEKRGGENEKGEKSGRGEGKKGKGNSNKKLKSPPPPQAQTLCPDLPNGICDCPTCVQERASPFFYYNNNNNTTTHIQEPTMSGALPVPSPTPEAAAEVNRTLRPNAIWTQEDCTILEELEARYRDNKWLQIQASFFNWTGRMVAAEIIEKKFREDKAI